MEQSSLEKLTVPQRAKTLRNWWNPKVRYRIHNSTPPAPYQSITRSLITFAKTYSNIILQFTPRSFKSSFLSFPDPVHSTYPAPLILNYMGTQITFNK